MEYALACLLGYFLGCLSPAKLVSLIKGVDLKKNGSGNLGASNTTMLLGWKWGIAVGVCDFFKGVLAVVILLRIYPYETAAAALCGTAAVMGHIFPFYMDFKGGKGFATLIGVICGFNFWVALAFGVVIISIAYITDYIVIGTMLTIVGYPVWLLASTGNIPAFLMTLPITVVVFIKHLPNLKRMASGTEFKASDAAAGKDRIGQ